MLSPASLSGRPLVHLLSHTHRHRQPHQVLPSSLCLDSPRIAASAQEGWNPDIYRRLWLFPHTHRPNSGKSYSPSHSAYLRTSTRTPRFLSCTVLTSRGWTKHRPHCLLWSRPPQSHLPWPDRWPTYPVSSLKRWVPVSVVLVCPLQLLPQS